MSLESGNERLTFFQTDLAEPCTDCAAPCCTMVVLPHPAPVRWMDFDFLRYTLGFPGMEALLYEDGRWGIAVRRECSKFDAVRRRCTVHATPEQPRTCVYYNPHHCWYKRNFTVERPPDVLKLDLRRLEQLLKILDFDAEGMMVGWPGWPNVREALDPQEPAVVEAQEPAALDPQESAVADEPVPQRALVP